MPRANGDSASTRQLDADIAALRTIMSIVASADTLAHLSDEVRLLSLRVERLNGAEGGESLPAHDQSAPGTQGAKVLQPSAWRARPQGCDEQKTIARNPKGNRREARRVTRFEARPLLLLSSTAAVLVAIFVTAMVMLEAVQPRVHVPTASGAHKIAARRAPSFLISPVPIVSQSFNPAPPDHAGEASASLDGLDQRREFRASGR
jgi:hypothetical protein